MSQQPAVTALHPHLRSLGETFLTWMPCPAALVIDGTSVIAANSHWHQLTGCRPRPAGSSALRESLHGFSGVEALVTPLRTGTQSVGSTTLLGPPDTASTGEPSPSQYVARWRQIESGEPGRAYALVFLDASEAEQLESVISSQRIRINELLLRQVLTEEDSRRRLGRILHDGAAQHLAHIRRQLQSARWSSDETAPLVAELDEAIKRLRDLAFELSPPVLEDLGLLPALQWLAEHLGRRYETTIELADDGTEPRLSSPTRTVVFRAMRELATNAAKHAAGAGIVLFSRTSDGTACLGVRDTGPGFDADAAGPSARGFHGFGLLSVEQQIRAIGGSLEIVSIRGEGTRTTITIPCDGESGDGV